MTPKPQTTFAQTFTSAATTSNQTDTVMSADPGIGFAVSWIGISIESGAGSDVDVQLFVGETPIAPSDDGFDIAGEFVRLPTRYHIGPDTEIVARHDNTSSTARDVTVIVAGSEHDGS